MSSRSGRERRIPTIGRIVAVVSIALSAVAVTLAQATPAAAVSTYTEYVGGNANTWTNYTNAGGSQGATIPAFTSVQITCALSGFRVTDGNTWWYQIASSPWNNSYYVSADAFYNNGASSGSLVGTPYVDPAVPICGAGGAKNEITGGNANTWTSYTNAGGTQGATIPAYASVSISCAVQGFRVTDGNTWWYQIASSPWNNSFYVSADAFYNNGASSGSLVGTPYVDPAIPLCGSGGPPGGNVPPPPPGGTNETAGGLAHTWTDYVHAGGSAGPTIAQGQTVSIACKASGFAVTNGNTWWYQIASSPWSGNYFVSADAFYNNGATSGSLIGTPYVDTAVPSCALAGPGRPSGETTGGDAHTWANYTHAGSYEGPTIPNHTTVQVSCRVTGFRVADGNTWWYLISSAPWNNNYYVSADPFYNNGATSGPLTGTPFVDPSVPICVGNQEAPIYSSAYGSSSAGGHATGCVRADPVNCASGDFWQTYTDISIKGRGPGLELTRTYNALGATTSGLFGNGWSSSIDQHLEFSQRDGSILVVLADGSKVQAQPDGNGGYTLPTSSNDSLVGNPDGTYTFTLKATKFLTYSAVGKLLSIRDLNGYLTSFGYDGAGFLTAVTDTSGRRIQITHDVHGLVTAASDPMGRVTSFVYNAAGNLTSFTDPIGSITRFSYDSNNRIVTLIDPRGGHVTNEYDSDGRVTSQTDPMGRTTRFSYTGDNFSALGGTTTVTDPLGHIELEQYADGFMNKATKGYGTAEEAAWTYVYDQGTYGLLSETDPEGHTTTNTYSSSGQLLTTTDALGRTTTHTYNEFNEVTRTWTPQHEESINTYDTNGNPVTSTDPLGLTTTSTYGDTGHPGDVISTTSPGGVVTDYTYDSYGNRSSVSGHRSASVVDTSKSTYDLDGEIICKTTSNQTAAGALCAPPGSPPNSGISTTTFDGDGRVLSATDALSHTTTYTYDAAGNKVSETDPNSHTTSYAYDTDNEQTSITTPGNGTSTTSYDNDGNVMVNMDANGHITMHQYDHLNREVSTIDALGHSSHFTYDRAGNRLTTVDADNRTTTNTYDTANELTNTAYSDLSTHSVTYTYDADGERISMIDGTGASSYSYDADQRLLASTDGGGHTVSRSYDNDGRVLSLTYPDSQVVSQAFDGAGNLSAISDGKGHTSSFTYDADHNLTSQAMGNTVDNFTYDSTDQMASVTVLLGAKVLAGYTYTRDASSLVTTATLSSKKVEHYSYNANDQVTADAAGSYTYDPAGNLTAALKVKPMSYGPTDQLLSNGTPKKLTNYSYDAEGDRTSVSTATTSTTYGYDQALRLTSYVQGSTTAQYSYNGDGLRMSKTVGSVSTPFAWDTSATIPLLLTDGSNNYIYGPGGMPLESISATAQVSFYHHDYLGSTILVTGVTGTKLASFVFDAYGVIKSRSGTISVPLLFDGQYLDTESGLYYMRARYYEPSTGQFISVDPLNSLSGTPYRFAKGNPMSYADPTGAWSISVFGWCLYHCSYSDPKNPWTPTVKAGSKVCMDADTCKTVNNYTKGMYKGDSTAQFLNSSFSVPIVSTSAWLIPYQTDFMTSPYLRLFAC